MKKTRKMTKKRQILRKNTKNGQKTTFFQEKIDNFHEKCRKIPKLQRKKYIFFVNFVKHEKRSKNDQKWPIFDQKSRPGDPPNEKMPKTKMSNFPAEKPGSRPGDNDTPDPIVSQGKFGGPELRATIERVRLWLVL